MKKVHIIIDFNNRVEAKMCWNDEYSVYVRHCVGSHCLNCPHYCWQSHYPHYHSLIHCHWILHLITQHLDIEQVGEEGGNVFTTSSQQLDSGIGASLTALLTGAVTQWIKDLASKVSKGKVGQVLAMDLDIF